jgi:hypothetical protein
VHTAGFPDGAIRGQLSAVSTTFASALTGEEEAPGPGETGVTGGTSIEPLTDGTTVCSFTNYDGTETPTAAHIHKGAVGAAGPIVVTLPPFDGSSSDGCVGGVDPAVVADIRANPEDYYVNVHTDGHPNGAVRGQLQETIDLTTSLAGADEVPGPGDPDGAGDAGISLIGDDEVCVTIHVRGTALPTAAHIHKAADGVAGPVVETLLTPTFNTSGTCMTIDSALYDELAASPGDFYVNVHTRDFPNGAVRGQLSRVVHAVGSPTASRGFVHAAPRSMQKLRYASTRSR